MIELRIEIRRRHTDGGIELHIQPSGHIVRTDYEGQTFRDYDHAARTAEIVGARISAAMAAKGYCQAGPATHFKYELDA